MMNWLLPLGTDRRFQRLGGGLFFHAPVGSDFESHRKRLDDCLIGQDTLYGGRPFPSLPGAFVLPGWLWRESADVLATICDLLETAARWGRDTEKLVAHWQLSEGELAMFRRTPWPRRIAPGVRFDCLMDRDGIKVVEVNTIFAFLAPSDGLATAQRSLGILDEVEEGLGLVQTPLVAKFRDYLRGMGINRLGLVGHKPDNPMTFEYRYTLAALRRAGMEGAHGYIGALADGSGPTIEINGAPVDGVFLREPYVSWPSHPEQRDVILRAVERGMPMFNPFEAMLIGSKASLAALHHPEFQSALTGWQREVIARHVPETIVIPTQPGEQREALLNRLAAERNLWVLKPVDGWGGDGVVVGQYCAESAWPKQLEATSARRHVAQRLVRLATVDIPRCSGGHETHFANLCIFAIDGQPEGGCARTSPKHIVNVLGTNIGSGGAVMPLFTGERL